MRTITIFHIQFELKNNIAVFRRLYKDFIHGRPLKTISEINMKFYFFILCSISNVEGGVWFGPKDGLGGDDGEIINFMRPRKVFAAYTNVIHTILFVAFNGPYNMGHITDEHMGNSFVGQIFDNCDHLK